MQILFTDKIVVITGAAGGLGSGMARRFAEDGAKIAVCDIRGAETIAEELTSKGYTAIGYNFDITNREEVTEYMDKIEKDLGKIDVLINNAGINVPSEERHTTDGFSDKWWDSILAVDLDGTYNCTKLAYPHFAKGACIINTSSIVGMVPLRNQCAFAAAKAAVINYTKAVAMELAPMGIRANVICPGTIGLEITNRLWTDDSVMQALIAHIPLSRQGVPNDIASAAEFLASDYAAYITGAVLPVDGGWTCGGYARNF